MLAGLLEEEEMASSLPEAAYAMFRLTLDLLAGLDGKTGSRQGDRAACSRGRSIAQADDRSWHRPDLCYRDRRSSTAGRDLCQGPRLRRLAWSHASSKIGQAASGSLGRHPKWANARSGRPDDPRHLVGERDGTACAVCAQNRRKVRELVGLRCGDAGADGPRYDAKRC
jgi:hypothetical protein